MAASVTFDILAIHFETDYAGCKATKKIFLKEEGKEKEERKRKEAIW